MDPVHPRLTRAAFLRLLLLLVCAAVLFSTPLGARAHEGPRRVLILHSYHQGLAWTDDVQAALSATLAQSGLPLEMDVKYLDATRMTDPKAFRRNVKLLHRQLVDEFVGKRFDLVLVSDNAALDFVLEHREQLTGSAPVVFCGVNNFSPDMLRGQSNITGVAETPSFDATMDLALKLCPKASKLLVLAEETISGKANQALLHAQSAHFSRRVEIELSKETDIHKLEARLAALGPEWIVLPMVRPLDEHGMLSAREASQRLSRASTVPLFAAWDFWMGHGPAAGVVVSANAQGETAASMAIRILKGERAESIPVVRRGHNVTMADHNSVARFGMPESQLPENALLLNAPVSFYAVNKSLFWAGGLVGLCLLLFSICLALNVSRRKRAEELYRGQLSFVQTLMGAMPAPVFFKDTGGRYLGVNPAFETLTGKPAQDFIGRLPSEVFPQEHGQVFVQRDQEISQLGDMQRYEHVMPTALGLRTLVVTKAVFPGNDGSPAGIVGILTDITERKQAEESLRESEERHRALFAAVSDPVLVANRDTGILLECNEAAERYFGRSREQLIGLPQRELHPPVTLQGEGLTEDFKRVAIDPNHKEEISLLAAGGEVRDVEVTASSFEIGNKQLILGVFRDVTERKQAEEALRESEGRFRSLFENAPLAYQSLDAHGRFLDVNRKWLEALGYADKEQVLGTWFGDHLAPGFREHFDLNFPMFKQACVIDGIEFEMVRADGGHITVSFNGRVQTNREGHFVRTHCIFTDITERKKAEEALRVSQEHLQAIFRVAPTGIGVVKNRVMVRVNQRVCSMTGYAEEELLGQSARMLYPSQEEFDFVGQEKYRQISEKGTGEVETRWLRKDGAIIDLFMASTPLDPRDISLGVTFTAVDITERKKAEASLNAIKWLVDKEVSPVLAPQASPYGDLVTLNSSRIILDAVGGGILADMIQDFMDILGTSSAVYEKNGDYALGIFASNWCQTMDQASRRLCGCASNAEALAGGKWLCHESCWTEAAQTAIETRQPADIACKGGIRLYAVPIRSGDEIVGAINFGYGTPPRDRKVIAELAALYQVDPDELWKLSMEYEHRPDFIIDTAKQRLKTTARLIGEMVSRSMAEQHLQKAMQNAEAASRAKSEFLANMSHEIRTPLNGVLGMLQLIRDSKVSGAVESYAEMATRAGQRLTSLLGDILDLSRIEAGRMPIVNKPFILADIFTALAETFSPMHYSKRLSLVIHASADIPAVVVGDDIRVRQVLFNLVGNAMKFTDRGEVRVEVSTLQPHPSGMARLLFIVSDTGLGIPDDKIDQICNPFTQVSSDFTRPHQGAGLGLAIAQKLIDAMDGTLTFESVEDMGTSVYLMLPFSIPEQPPLPVHQQLAHGGEPSAPLRLLLVEDEEISRLSARLSLEKLGHKVDTASNGEEALEALRGSRYDCVLMDVQMGVMDGLEATRRIRSGTAGVLDAQVPIVAMTAYAMSGDRERFLAVGMDDYVAKPVQMASLLKALERVRQ